MVPQFLTIKTLSICQETGQEGGKVEGDSSGWAQLFIFFHSFWAFAKLFDQFEGQSFWERRKAHTTSLIAGENKEERFLLGFYIPVIN